MRRILPGLLVLAVSSAAHGAAKDVLHGPAPAWVLPAPDAKPAAPEGPPVRVVYVDNQVRLGPSNEEYSAYRIKLAAPEALAAGNIALRWSPSSQQVTVHRLHVLRDGRQTDVLAASKFAIVQRENNLELAMLDGALTATLQIPGLQVGDEIEFAATIRSRDATLGDSSQGFLQLPVDGTRGAFRARLLWPEQRAVHWQATPELGKLTVVQNAGNNELEVTLTDPDTALAPEGAPARYAVRRLIQYTSFDSWAAISRLMAPLYQQAAALKPGSPLKAEAQRIAAEARTPTARAEAALRLVQDRIRYVYIGLDDGNYRPASAEQSWERRFGDCKAKTAMLIALLEELGIAAEAVMVSSTGGDGTDRRLATTDVFDHVLVRATIDGKAVWLDGTRMGDRRLAALPQPTFRWALAARAGGAALEPVTIEPSAAPQKTEVLDIDASKGFGVPAAVRAQHIFRGDPAFAIRSSLAAQTPGDAKRTMSSYWRRDSAWIDPAETSWRYDEDRGVLVLSMSGEGKLDWEGEEASGRRLSIFGAGFVAPSELKRPREQDQTAPWATDFPRFTCWATTIRLPSAGAKHRWNYSADPVDRRLAGTEYWRAALLDQGVMRTVMSRRVYRQEVTAAEAKLANALIPGFDNNVSQVFEETGEGAAVKPSAKAAFLGAPIDWSSDTAPCRAGGASAAN